MTLLQGQGRTLEGDPLCLGWLLQGVGQVHPAVGGEAFPGSGSGGRNQNDARMAGAGSGATTASLSPYFHRMIR